MAASWWLRSCLLSALSRDLVDAANDAEALAQLLGRGCQELWGENTQSLKVEQPSIPGVTDEQSTTINKPSESRRAE